MTSRIVVAVTAATALAFSLACGGSSTIDTSYLLSAGTGGGTASCPADASTASAFSNGDAVVLLAIHSEDAYAGSEHERNLPISGRVDGDLHNNGECWFGGGFVADDGTSFYFYKGAFKAR
jgi:hypothetical protein